MENKSLFQISQEYLSMLEQIEDMEGELTPEMEQALVINRDELQAKGGNYLNIIDYLNSQIQMSKVVEDRAKVFRKRKENQINRLKANLLNAVELFGKFEVGVATVSARKSEAVIVEFEDDVPDKFKRIKQSIVVDKAAIKKAIKAGEEVEGARLVTNNNLSIK